MPKTEHHIHPIQASILKAILYRSEARFSELNAEKIPSDQFNFHLKQLLQEGILEKENEKYRLTSIGKEFANRFDTDSGKVAIERQAKIGVLITCVNGTGPSAKYLVQQRLKHPYYGYHGFLTGKIKWGETVHEAAIRELDEETGLSADLTLHAIKHKMDYDREGKLLEDKYFFIFLGENPKGTLRDEFPGGKNFWLTKKELFALPDLFDGVKESLEAATSKSLEFLERQYSVKGY